MVAILGLGAHIDYSVNQARPAQNPATRIGDFKVVQIRFLGGREALGNRGMVQKLDVTGRNVDIRIPVLAPRFKRDHARIGVFRQPIGPHTAGRAGTNDDISACMANSLPPGSNCACRFLPNRRPNKDSRATHINTMLVNSFELMRQ